VALKLISAEARSLQVTADSLSRLQWTILEGAADAGQSNVEEKEENDIIESHPNGLPEMVFRPVPISEIPLAMDELCKTYNAVLNQQDVHPLLAVGALVFDFLCLRPFRDGNGRVSRLLALLRHYQNGFEVGRCISLEHLIEKSRDDYYVAI
jgi:Fic family protein